MVNESFMAGPSASSLAARHQELGQAEPGQDRGGLVGSRQGRLQLQDLACDLIGRDGLGAIDEVLELGLGLGLPCSSGLHLGLGSGEIGLNVRNRLLPRLGRQVLGDTRRQRRSRSGCAPGRAPFETRMNAAMCLPVPLPADLSSVASQRT